MSTPKKSKDIQVLLKADSATIALTAEKTGHIRVNAHAMAQTGAVLPGEVLVIRWENGQVVAVRRKK